MQRRIEAQIFIMLSIVGHFSLFPLIFTSHETPIKVKFVDSNYFVIAVIIISNSSSVNTVCYYKITNLLIMVI